MEMSFSVFEYDRWVRQGQLEGTIGMYSGLSFGLTAADCDKSGEAEAGVRTVVKVWPGGHDGDPTYETVTDVFKTFELEVRDERDD